MYVYCMEVYIYCIYSAYLLYRSMCPLVVWSYTVGWACQYPQPQKYTVLSESFVFSLGDFDLHVFFQERNSSVNWGLPVRFYWCILPE